MTNPSLPGATPVAVPALPDVVADIAVPVPTLIRIVHDTAISQTPRLTGQDGATLDPGLRARLAARFNTWIGDLHRIGLYPLGLVADITVGEAVSGKPLPAEAVRMLRADLARHLAPPDATPGDPVAIVILRLHRQADGRIDHKVSIRSADGMAVDDGVAHAAVAAWVGRHAGWCGFEHAAILVEATAPATVTSLAVGPAWRGRP